MSIAERKGHGGKGRKPIPGFASAGNKVLDYAEKMPHIGTDVKKVRGGVGKVLKHVKNARNTFRKIYKSEAVQSAGKLLDKTEKVHPSIKKYRDKARKVIKKI